MKFNLKVIDFLKRVKKRPDFYVLNPTPENVKIFLDGIKIGMIIEAKDISINGYSEFWLQVVETRNWKSNTLNFERQLRQNGMSEDEIVDELISISIEVWKLINQSIRGNLST